MLSRVGLGQRVQLGPEASRLWAWSPNIPVLGAAALRFPTLTQGQSQRSSGQTPPGGRGEGGRRVVGGVQVRVAGKKIVGIVARKVSSTRWMGFCSRKI